MEPDLSNQYFEMAVQFVNQTSQHLFLTGKAGTGKTTFLKYIKDTSHKKLAIVAPTGVAAINAGGTTIHSFLQLPFGSFLPGDEPFQEAYAGNFYNRRSLLKHLRFSKDKRELIQELDLLIIDEVSMVRADLLDAVDMMLRHIRRKHQVPFGGVQMLYIGDLSQLPPVVKEHDWKILSQYYESQFFFHAHALKQATPLYLELKKIYRQSDVSFIKILNNIRNNEVTKEDLDVLHQHYRPGFKPDKKGEYITLTTHNAKADLINQKELKNLSGKEHTFDAIIEGEFNERSYPAESRLQLKEGAQIMFIRNDKGEERRYYNGKIGTIKQIKRDEIFVVFPDESQELLLEREEWKNLRYHFNKEEDKVEEEEIGTFTQYPIRLAWAITIHKSQGLTFRKAIIDAGESFAPGQVYVALSRLTSLDGLILYSKIYPHCISTDEKAIAFSETELETEDLKKQLQTAQKSYVHYFLLNVFSWQKMAEIFEEFLKNMEGRRIPDLEEARIVAMELYQKTLAHKKIATTFSTKLQQMLTLADYNGYALVNERVEAAGKYFHDALYKDIFVPLHEHYDKIKGKTKVKKYAKDIQDVVASCKQKKTNLEQAMEVTSGLVKGVDPAVLFKAIKTSEKPGEDEFKLADLPSNKKKVKGESHQRSLEMFEAGKTIEEIATERGLAKGTIEGHLISFIPSGKLTLSAIVSEEKTKAIERVLEDLGEVPSSQIKEKLGENFSYGEIRAVLVNKKALKEA